ncbi:helix-turn-helix domain-containing protein, partial [Candidatus Woesearchaeota archaeon]|nr:helix-turn-helix domain-containing protein [Candidatus Woesearchaeota archaeon]
KKITILRLSKPERNINDELQWLGNSLGLFSIRDKDKSCFRIFLELLKSSKQRTSLSSDEIALRLELTRGTIIHHINKLMNSGLVIQEKQRYMLRVERLSNLIEELHRDMARACKEIREVAKDIDNWLGL